MSRGGVRSVVAAGALVVAGLGPATAAPAPGVVRIATFNCSLNRPAPGGLRASLATPDDTQARAVAEIIQRVRPDILLLQEFDFDANGGSIGEFQANYLGVAQNRQAPIAFAHTYSAPSNTGVPSGFDLDHDGKVGGGEDALGFGEFPGQYGMALFSRFPLAPARTFRKFLWRDVPGALLPDRVGTPQPADWYPPEQLAVLPLSSKSHWDVRVEIGAHRVVHLLISHPTPPAFDGPEDRNGLRNHDEIRFWNDYLSGADYMRDDAGRRGGFDGGSFLVMGDQNSDPVDGGSRNDAIRALLANPRLTAFTPSSAGGPEAAAAQGGANATQHGDPRNDTADFNDRAAGNLRVDYLLPSKDLRVCGGGIFWPAQADPDARLVWGDAPPPSSDHRLVWIDVLTSDRARCPPGSDLTASAPSHPRR
jgi:hypothetical protein